MERLLEIIREKYLLTGLPAGEWEHLKVKGMKFHTRAFDAEGLGHVCVMEAKGFFGLMNMDTLVITPTKRDLPLYSYDRISAMGRETLIVELYDTMNGPCDLGRFDKITASGCGAALAADPSLKDPGPHWYDEVRLPQSMRFEGKKSDASAFEKLAVKALEAYLDTEAVPVADAAEKAVRNRTYVDALLSNGGVSTDIFKAKFGEEKTAEFYHKVFFGV